MLLSTRVPKEGFNSKNPNFHIKGLKSEQIFLRDMFYQYFNSTPDLEFAISESAPDIHISWHL